jgi:transmembrane sensor
MDKKRLQELLHQHRSGQLSEPEKMELSVWFNAREQEELLLQTMQEELLSYTSTEHYHPEEWQPLLKRVLAVDKETSPARVHRVHLLRTWSWAAAAVLVVLAGIYTWTSRRASENKPVAIVDKQDVAPGGNKAVLKLADGTTIVLDSMANGTVATQGNTVVLKRRNGELAYNTEGRQQGKEMLNTVTTPKGGQYQLVLPDGTHVWLNAASSITFPATFTGVQRKVQVTGEVYFEVAKDRKKPFIVDADGRHHIQVLGTHFNVNAYRDESSVVTTLLEGSVQVSDRQGGMARLQPGEQALSVFNAPSSQYIRVVAGANLRQVMAWKNGYFNFDHADLHAVMRQLERWYNIEVRYEGRLPRVSFRGGMDRTVNLSEVLTYFAELGIATRLEGRTLTIGK